MVEHRYVDAADRKVTLTDLELKKDVYGNYYMAAKYRIEDTSSIRELSIPHIHLNISQSKAVIRMDYLEICDKVTDLITPEADIGLGFMPLLMENPRNMAYFTETVLEEKTHEMTLDEIEKKLGYKVKIVNK